LEIGRGKWLEGARVTNFDGIVHFDVRDVGNVTSKEKCTGRRMNS
jgi:hypothetical protein